MKQFRDFQGKVRARSWAPILAHGEDIGALLREKKWNDFMIH